MKTHSTLAATHFCQFAQPQFKAATWQDCNLLCNLSSSETGLVDSVAYVGSHTTGTTASLASAADIFTFQTA